MQKPTPEPAREHTPGQAFDDPSRPLGTTLLERASPRQLPDRAKAIAVLRRTSELVKYGDPRIETEARLQQAVDVASRDVGMKPEEYRAIVRKDVELKELEHRCLDTFRATFPR